MAVVRTCSESPTYTGFVGAWVIYCDKVTSLCGVSWSDESDVSEVTQVCNGITKSISQINAYRYELVANLTLEGLATILNQPLTHVTHQGVTGRGMIRPTGVLPTGYTIVAITRGPDGAELHDRVTNATLVGYSKDAYTTGNAVNMTFNFTSSDAEMLEFDQHVAPILSKFLALQMPYHAWTLCGCEDGDQVTTIIDDVNEKPLAFSNTEETVVKLPGQCCGLLVDAGSCFSFDVTDVPGTEFGVIVQGSLTESGTIMEGVNGGTGNFSVTWDNNTNLLTVQTLNGDITYPFSGGDFTVGYSYDGVFIINGTSVAGLGPNATIPETIRVMCDTELGQIFGAYYFNRGINVSDVI